jgi:hypothetical protein
LNPRAEIVLTRGADFGATSFQLALQALSPSHFLAFFSGDSEAFSCSFGSLLRSTPCEDIGETDKEEGTEQSGQE